MTGSTCRICGASALEEFAEFATLQQVTSDCRPWPGGGHLSGCASCGTTQKPHNRNWVEDCGKIYANYELYAQAGGVEQSVFEPSSGGSAVRSARLLERISQCTPIPAAGRLLDVGCGNGSFLRAFHSRTPGWRLNGAELHDRYRKEIESIRDVEGFHQKPAQEVPGMFDWIVLMHVLEHLPEPGAFLTDLRAKLRPGGTLLIEVPDHRHNPFELAVADHACHFTPETLDALLTSAGFDVNSLADDWIPRELTAMAKVGTHARTAAAATRHSRGRNGYAAAQRGVQWLAATAAHARLTAAAAGIPIGVFGSSVAATWLAAELGRPVACFVDEDPNRSGRTHMDRPIVHPDRVPAAVTVYLALPRLQAEGIDARLRAKGLRLNLVLPPTEDASKLRG